MKLLIAHGSVKFREPTPFDLLIVDEPNESLYGRETDRDLHSACASRNLLFIFLRTSSVCVCACVCGGEGYAARLFLLFSFPCSADLERDWTSRKAVFFRVGNQYAEYEK